MSDHPANNELRTRWRYPAVAAAAIVVVGIGAIAFAVSNTNADGDEGVSQAPGSTAAPTTSSPTATVAPPTEAELVPGTDLTVSYTLPDGWEADDSPERVALGGEFSTVVFWPDVDNVYADGCEHTLLDPPLGPTVDDLATVWADVARFLRDDTGRHQRRRLRRQAGRLHRPRLHRS